MSPLSARCLLFFSLERWDDIWRRNQFICAGLLDRHPELRILWVNPPVDAFANPDWIRYASGGATAMPGLSRLWTVDLLKPLPNIIGRAINEAMFLTKVQGALAKLHFSDPIVWINDQNMAPLVRSLGLSPMVYDITDDWISASLTSRQRATVIRNDSWLVQHARHVIVCSPKLRDLKAAAKSLHLIPNGVEYMRYHPDQLKKFERPEELLALSGAIIGYTGTLHEDRLDISLLCELAAQLPDANFVFVGPNCLNRDNEAQLVSLKNVKLLGRRPYAQLPNYMAAFDICLVPHNVNAFTDSLDPLKLYEYFATGKPVVSTPCAGFRDFPKLVHLSTDASDMAAAIRATLVAGEGQHLSEARLSFARGNDWRKRIMEIEPLLAIDSKPRFVKQ